MKKIFLLLGSIGLFTSEMHAQTASASNEIYKNEVELDLTLLVAKLFGASGYYYAYDIYGGYWNQSPGAYLIGYKRYFGNSALRIGFGSDMNNSSTETVGSDGVNEYANSRIDCRVGYEFQQRLAEKWNLFYGLDLQVSMISNEYSYAYPDQIYNYSSTTSIMSFGGGPLIGISWFINKRIKLSTDASLLYCISNSETKMEYEDQPEINYSSKTNANSLKANYPMFLYLDFLF